MKPIESLLPDPLVRRTQTLEQLNVVLRSCAPANLVDQLSVANYTDKFLTVQATDHIWATNARYQQHELLRCLNARAAANFTELRITVRPAPAPTPPSRAPNPERTRVLAALRKIARSLD